MPLTCFVFKLKLLKHKEYAWNMRENFIVTTVRIKKFELKHIEHASP